MLQRELRHLYGARGVLQSKRMPALRACAHQHHVRDGAVQRRAGLLQSELRHLRRARRIVLSRNMPIASHEIGRLFPKPEDPKGYT